jgi:exportin-T
VSRDDQPGGISLTWVVLRNKLAYTLAHLFVNTFPTPITNFLHPFFALLAPPDPSSSKQNFHPPLLAMRLLSEISLEVHDTTIRATRDYNAARQQKDGTIRDSIRTTGDERLAVDGLLGLAQKGLDVVESGSGDRNKWIDVTSQALKTLASWIRTCS